jgi:hypothetical protein
VGGVISLIFANSTGGGTSANGTGFKPANATIVQKPMFLTAISQ